MSGLIVLGAALLAVSFVVWRRFSPSLSGLVDQAVREGTATGLLTALERRSPSAQPVAFNHAIRRLWNLYERSLTVDLIRALAAGHADTKIAQFWLKELQVAEPKLAKQLSKEFLDAHYRPEVAAQCGAVG